MEEAKGHSVTVPLADGSFVKGTKVGNKITVIIAGEKLEYENDYTSWPLKSLKAELNKCLYYEDYEEAQVIKGIIETKNNEKESK
jgi:protein-arginine kinase activator protein McsA